MFRKKLLRHGTRRFSNLFIFLAVSLGRVSDEANNVQIDTSESMRRYAQRQCNRATGVDGSDRDNAAASVRRDMWVPMQLFPDPLSTTLIMARRTAYVAGKMHFAFKYVYDIKKKKFKNALFKTKIKKKVGTKM